MGPYLFLFVFIGVFTFLFLISRIFLKDSKNEVYEFVEITPEELMRMGYIFLGNFKKDTINPLNPTFDEIKKEYEKKGWKNIISSIAVENDFTEGYEPRECYSLWGKRKLVLAVDNSRKIKTQAQR